jgi:hypothetical protein
MFRFGRAALLAMVALSVAPAAASAVPAHKDTAYLGALWTKVFETPSAQNPFGTGGPGSGCFRLGDTVAPFGPTGVGSCSVRADTKIFVTASSFECSTFEGNGTTVEQLRSCARQEDVQVAPTVSVDGESVLATEVETGPLHLVLPADNIFGLPAGSRGLSVAHGWVALRHPLRPGTHTIVIQTSTSTITTTINVKRGR